MNDVRGAGIQVDQRVQEVDENFRRVGKERRGGGEVCQKKVRVCKRNRGRWGNLFFGSGEGGRRHGAKPTTEKRTDRGPHRTKIQSTQGEDQKPRCDPRRKTRMKFWDQRGRKQEKREIALRRGKEDVGGVFCGFLLKCY